MRIPAGLHWLRADPRGAAWVESLPRLVAETARRWSLTVGDPYQGGHASLVLPALTMGGDPVVVKLQYPDRESRHEAAALEAWNGRAAVRLLDHAPDAHALLLERCDPGAALSTAGPDVALDVLVGLVPQLSVVAPAGVGTLKAEAARWIDGLPGAWHGAGRPFERRLLDAAIDTLDALAATQSQQVLLHQDLHGDNVLSAQRRPWLAIDPKPLVGDPAFQVAPIVRSSELGTTKADVVHRLDRLCADLGLDRDRARGWTLAQTLAWGFENGKVLDWHVQVSRWMAERAI